MGPPPMPIMAPPKRRYDATKEMEFESKEDSLVKWSEFWSNSMTGDEGIEKGHQSHSRNGENDEAIMIPGEKPTEQDLLIQRHVLSVLRAQEPYKGWQARLEVTERAMKICQL